MRKFITGIDLTQSELQNAAIHKLASAPSSPVEGQLYYNTTDKNTYVWDGTAWDNLTATGGGGGALTDLSDVTITTPADFELLQQSGGEWINRTAEEAGVMTFHGFVFPYEVSLSYVGSTRTLTITPTGSTFDVWVGGKKYTKTGVQTFVHSNVAGDHFIYYDTTGTLVESSTPWDFKVVTPVAFVYYNTTLSDGYALFELHTYKRNMEWHESQHFAIGTFIKSGFAISGYTLNTATDAANTFAIASGVVVDEDIEWDVSALADAGPYTIVYRSGATAVTWTTNTLPFLNGAGTFIQYNQNNAGNWQMTTTVTARWVNYYVFVTTALNSARRIYIVPGQAVYTSLALAQAESVGSLDLSSFGLTEFAPLYQLTFTTLTADANTGKCRLVAVARITNSKGALNVNLTAALHNSLTGRSDADSHPTSAITGLDAALAAKGTVSSVGLTLPAELTVSGSPVTGSGTLAAVWANQSASGTSGKVFAGPVAGSSTPTFRLLLSDDIPALPQSRITNLTTDIATLKKVPLTISNANVTLAQADSGKGYYKDDTSAYTYTIPDGLEVGTIFTLANLGSAGNITVSMSGTEVLRLSGSTTTGSRTIASYSEGTFHKVNSTTWLAGGQGVT